MFDCIIPIGQTCNITFLLQNAKLKKYTTLFEWFVSPHLNHITDILTKIGNNTDTDIIKTSGKYIFMGDSIYSEHYTPEVFMDIYKRRRDRLVDTIKSSKNILFVRFESNDIHYHTAEIDNFINSVLAIHPNLENVKLFLISPNTKMEHPSLIPILYTKHKKDPFCKSQEINDLFVTNLEKHGYNVHSTSNECFTDMSEL
jgi:hypothetical protein